MKRSLLILAGAALAVCLSCPAFAEQLVNAGFCQAQKPALHSAAFDVDRPSDTRVCFFLEPTDILAAGCGLTWEILDEKTDAPVLSGTAQLNTDSAWAVCSRKPLAAGIYELHARCVQKHTPNFCVRGVIAR